jgi:N-acetylneuraminic acid mutarotase
MNTTAQHRRRLGLVVLVGALAVLAAASTPARAAGTWTALAPLPAPTEGMQVGAVGNEIIAAYGLSGGVDTTLTRRYDIDANTWSFGSAAQLPARSEGAATTHGGHLYAVGGRLQFVGPLSDLDRYTPASDSWVSLANMPTARRGLAVAAVGNALYAIGGSTGAAPCEGTPLGTVERYDIATDTWTTVASLPSPRSDLAAVARGGKIYVFGGCTGSPNAVLDDVDVYNPRTDTWSTAPADMPTARSSMYGAAAKGNRIYVIGGQANFVQLATNEFYKVASDSWDTDTPRPTPGAEMGVVSHGGRLYTVGGGFRGVSSAALFAFKP